MNALNHAIGGFAFTGVIGSLMGVNILESPEAIAITLVCSQLPDVDHPKSIIGRMLGPVSKMVNKRFGHRTFTHSLMGLMLFGLVFGILNKLLFPEIGLTMVAILSYLSHILIDTITKAGVQMFYPFVTNSVVMPGRTDFRLKSGDLKDEAMCFSFFAIVCVTMFPLMKDGFWTRYNRLFGTPAHLVSEFEKADDLLLAEWTVKEGTEERSGEGFVVNASSEDDIILIDRSSEQLMKLDGKVTRIVPEHVEDKELRFVIKSFVAITADSLNRLTSSAYIKKAHVQASEPFLANGQKIELLDWSWQNGILIEEIEDDIRTKEFIYEANPKIAVLAANIKAERERLLAAEIEYEKGWKEIEELEAELSKMEDFVEIEMMQTHINSLAKDAPSAPDHRKLEAMVVQLEALKSADATKNRIAKADIEDHNSTQIATTTRFTGTLNVIQF
ncbi:MAG: metal-dependent hydrolase [Bacteroidota bacterium]